jgi:hypothetical protein
MHLRMNAPGDAGSYTWVHRAPSDAQIADHILGQVTISIPLVDVRGLAHAWAVDLDTGGPANVRRHTEALAAAGLPCLGQAVKGKGDHDGGHIWGRWAEGVNPAAGRAQIAAALAAAGLPLEIDGKELEIWPRERSPLRAPLGLHTHSGMRGLLIRPGLPDASLDTPAGMALGLDELADLAASPPPPPLAAPSETPRPAGPMRPSAPSAGEKPITRFNEEHPMRELAESYGAWLNAKGHGTCGCGRKHNIFVTAIGYLVAYATGCLWKLPERGAISSFDLYTIEEHGGDEAAALAAIRVGAARAAASARRLTNRVDEGQSARPTRAPQEAPTLPEVSTALPMPRELATPPTPGLVAPRVSGKGGRIRVLRAVAALRQPSGDCTASKAQIAACASLKARQTQTLLGQLVALGLLDATLRYCESTIYRLTEGGEQFLRLTTTEGAAWLAERTANLRNCSHMDLETQSLSLMLVEEKGAAPQPAALDAGDLVEEAWAGGPAELLDVAALAAWPCDGLCDLPAELLPAAERAELAGDPGELAEEAWALLLLPALIAAPPALDMPSFPPACPAGPPEDAAAPAPLVEPVALGPVSFEGGCSFDPAAALVLSGSYTERPKDRQSNEAHYEAMLRRWAEFMASSPRPDAAAPALPEERVILGAPSDPKRRAAFYALQGAIRRTRNPAQRRILQRKLDALAEPVSVGSSTPAQLHQVAISTVWHPVSFRPARHELATVEPPPVIAVSGHQPHIIGLGENLARATEAAQGLEALRRSYGLAAQHPAGCAA